MPADADESAAPMLPPELLEHTASFLDRPKDLFALALAAKVFYNVIIPNHLHFRDLRCDLRRKSLWHALAERPRLTSRFRSLNLVSETEEPGYPLASGVIVVPRTIIEAGHVSDVPSQWISRRSRDRESALAFEDECIGAISAAVSCMSGLTRFSWVSNGSQWTQQPERLFAALRDSCPNLDELQIDVGEGWNWAFGFDTASSPLWELENLSKVSLSVQHSEGVKFTEPFKFVPLMQNMVINNCPFLQDLYIHYYGRDPICITAIFEHGHWPQLKRFSTAGEVRLDENETGDRTLIERFLKVHSALECLYLHGSFDSRLITIKPHTLPQLRSLSLNPIDISQPIFDTIQHLQHLAVIQLNGRNGYKRAKSFHHLGQMRALRSIYVADCDDVRTLQDLARTLPYLERLRFSCARPWEYNYSVASLENDDIRSELPSPECYDVFSTLDRLTHIANFITIDEHVAFEGFIEPVLVGLSRARKLQYVEVNFYHLSETKWVTVDRHEDGSYAGWHFTKDLRGVRYREWGGMFTHISENGDPERYFDSDI